MANETSLLLLHNVNSRLLALIYRQKKGMKFCSKEKKDVDSETIYRIKN